MGAEDWRVDPDLEQILHEVAADPRATLLRIARPKAIRTVFESSIVAREGATGLLSAERQLLSAHREELARLLRRACVMLIFESPQGRMYTMRQVTATYRHDPPTRERWLDQARTEIAAAKPDTAHELVTLLEHCVGDVAYGRATISQLAAASSRLQPTPQADIYQGEELAMNDAPLSAMRVYESALGKCASAQHSACAWTNIGSCRSTIGQHTEALAAHQRATLLDESRAMPWLNLFATALRANNSAAIQSAAQEIDSRWSSADAVIDAFLAFHEREPGKAEPTHGRRTCLGGIELGSASRRLADAPD